MEQIGEIYERLKVLEAALAKPEGLAKKVAKMEKECRRLKKCQERDALDIDRIFRSNGWSAEREF